MDIATWRDYKWKITVHAGCSIDFEDFCSVQFNDNIFKLSDVRKDRDKAREEIELYLKNAIEVEDFPPVKVIETMIDDLYEYLDNLFRSLFNPS